jgi:hypothetical protein
MGVRGAVERYGELTLTWPPAGLEDEIPPERQSLQLTPQAAQVFTDALNAPASVNERLAEALKRPRGQRYSGNAPENSLYLRKAVRLREPA